jgi:O-ureido-D-serine cyclo-ligase
MAAPLVALVTGTSLDDDDFDMPPLVEALARAGVEPRVLAWDDPAADVSRASLALLRSPWNYVHKYEAFLEWCDRCARLTRLLNPRDTVRWNSHKGYLLELEQRGVPIVPTRFIPAGPAPRLEPLVGDWDQVVIKPAVSAGSFATIRVGRDEVGRGEEHLRRFGAGRDMLVQRYMPAVETAGERSLVWLAGGFSHAIRKQPRWSGDEEVVSAGRVPIADDERALGERVLALVREPIAYARVDLVRDGAGALRLMELELIEPSLFFDKAPGAVDRFAEAIARLAWE